MILTTTVDNSLESTGDKINNNISNDTSDNIFLFSCKETKDYRDIIGNLTKKAATMQRLKVVEQITQLAVVIMVQVTGGYVHQTVIQVEVVFK